MNKKFRIKLMISSSLFMISLVGVIAAFYKNNQERHYQKKIDRSFDELVTRHAATMGAKHPKVYLVEFFDPACESCKVFHLKLKNILNQFKNDLRIVLKYADFHEHSLFAIKILEASKQQGKFWEVLDVLYFSQEKWGSHVNPNPLMIWSELSHMAQKNIININKLKKDVSKINDEELIKTIRQDLHLYEIHQTPTIFINKKLIKTLSSDDMVKFIQHEIDHYSDKL